MNLLKLWKKYKRIRQIITIVSMIITVLSIYLFFFDIAVNAGIIDVKDIGNFNSLTEKTTQKANSDFVENLLGSCEKIAKFYKDKTYTYDSEHSPWDVHYQDATNRTSCCSIYVLQVLVDIGQTDTLGGLDVGYVWDWLEKNPNWQNMGMLSENDIQAGDIQIYKGPKGDRIDCKW